MICKLDGCEEPHKAKGFCKKHYDRTRKLESPVPPTTAERFWSKVKILNNEDCWEWTASKDKDGYGKFAENKKDLRAHRYSWFLHTGERPKNLICHICDNPSCVNPSHLFDGTHNENCKDMVLKGRSLTGEKNFSSVLTEKNVILIKTLLENTTLSLTYIAKTFNVSIGLISHIKQGRAWKHVKR